MDLSEVMWARDRTVGVCIELMVFSRLGIRDDSKSCMKRERGVPRVKLAANTLNSGIREGLVQRTKMRGWIIQREWCPKEENEESVF